MSRPRSIASWILSGLLTALFLASAAGKLAAAEPVVKGMTEWGLADHRVLIGVGEAVSAILFILPRTSILGLLLLSSYMGGAIVTHMQHGESYVFQSVILLLIWLAGFLRHPELIDILTGRNRRDSDVIVTSPET
jgi:hypothetical protein